MYKFIDIDFEGRSVCDLTTYGATKYSLDKTTEILIIAWSFDDGKTIESYSPYFDRPQKLKRFLRKTKQLLRKGYKIRAFNAMFEFLIWNNVGVRQLNFFELKLENIYCCMVEACYMGYPHKLENAAKILGGEQKDERGGELIQFFSIPDKNGEFNDPLEHVDSFFEFIKYCEQDVTTQINVSNHCYKMSDFQYQVFILTEKMNLRGLPIDTDLCVSAQKLLELNKEILNKQINELTNGEIKKPTQNIAIVKYLQSNGFKIDNLTKQIVEMLLIQKDTPKWVTDILLIRQAGSKTSIAKYQSALTYLIDGRVHDFIKAYATATGRWAGRGLQPQNFSKPSKTFFAKYDMCVMSDMIINLERENLEVLYGAIPEVLKAGTRGMIKAPEGYKLIIADYAQIEARIVMWLADCETGMQDFAGKGLIYEKMAALIYNLAWQEIKKPSHERDLGKATVLGCVFGMGEDRFFRSCLQDGIEVNTKLAHKAVKGFRQRYSEVQEAWRECGRQCVKALKHPGQLFSACNGKITFIKRGSHLYMYIPSGRPVVYPFAYFLMELDHWGNLRPQVYYKTWKKNANVGEQWQSVSMWGGINFQHATQGTAGDIMAHGLLNAEKRGYPGILTVHDEGITLVPDKPEYNYKEYEQILCILPSYCAGLNIVAEGCETYRYLK